MTIIFHTGAMFLSQLHPRHTPLPWDSRIYYRRARTSRRRTRAIRATRARSAPYQCAVRVLSATL